MKDSSHFLRSAFLRTWHVSPLLLLSLAAIGGIILGEIGGIKLWALSGLCFAAASASFIFLDHRLIRTISAVGAVILGFAALHSQKIQEIQSFPLNPNFKNGETIRVSDVLAKVIAEPTLIGTGAQRSGRAVLKITEFNLASRTWKCRHQFPVFFEILPDDLKYGDEIKTSGIFQPLIAATSPGAFNEKKFHFRTNDAPGKFLVQSGDRIQVLRSNQANPVVSLAIITRKWLERALRHGIEDYPVESQSVITAMVLGNREDAPEEIEDLFRLSGTMHIFAVSGLHVGIIAGTGWLILPLFGVSRRTASMILIPAILFYAFITGLRPSAIRAAIMVCVVALAFCVRKNPRILNSLGCAALIILALNTQEIFQIGFQLSFAVLMTIVLFAEKIGRWFYAPFEVEPLMPRRLIARPRLWTDWVVKRLSDGLGVSLAAWIGSLLLIGWYFRVISLTGVLANIVMIPVATAIIGIAVMASICFAVHATWLTALLNQLNAFLASGLVKLAFFFSTIPGGYISTPNMQAPLSEDKPSAFSIEILANNGSAAQLFSIPALDAPDPINQRHWLIDSGDPFLFRGKIQPLLRTNGINELDGMFLSHGDQAHLGAAPIVIDRFNPKAIFESKLRNRARVYKEILSLAEAKAIQRVAISGGGQLDLGNDVRCRVLFPPEGYPDQSRADDHSLVLQFRHHQWKILFTFDAGFITEKWLTENERNLKSDIWIKGRHSTSPSGLESFLDKVDPKIVIATNAGFPVFEQIPDEWIEELKKRDIDFFDLTTEGTVSVRGSREKLQVRSFLNPDHARTLEKP